VGREHLRRGCTCYITPTVVNEYRDALPSSIVPLMVPLSASQLPNMVSIANAFEAIDVSERKKQKMKSDLTIVLSTVCPMITKELAQDKVVLVSANMLFLQRVLGSETKRSIVEEEINRHGLEHLIRIIGIRNDKYTTF